MVWNDFHVTICWHDVIVNFFWRCCVYFVNFSYWSKFYVNAITGSRVMTIFLHKGLTRNPEIGNTPVWVLPNIWRLGQVRETKFSKNTPNEFYWMLQNATVTAFTCFWVIKRKPKGGDKITPPRLGLKSDLVSLAGIPLPFCPL